MADKVRSTEAIRRPRFHVNPTRAQGLGYPGREEMASGNAVVSLLGDIS
jgi:hypothetical protein